MFLHWAELIFLKAVYHFFIKLNKSLPRKCNNRIPRNLLKRKRPHKHVQMNVMAALLMTVQTGSRLKCPATGERINKLQYTNAMEEYSAGRRNTLVVFATMQMLHTAQVHLCSTLQAKQRNRNLTRIAKETRVKGEKTDCKGTGGHFLG